MVRIFHEEVFRDKEIELVNGDRYRYCKFLYCTFVLAPDQTCHEGEDNFQIEFTGSEYIGCHPDEAFE